MTLRRRFSDIEEEVYDLERGARSWRFRFSDIETG